MDRTSASAAQASPISGATTADNVRAAIASGADGVIAKPFSAGKLVAELQRALARRSQRAHK